MPSEQASLYPQCENCDFYDQVAAHHQRCRKHGFVMPEVNWQIVCRDWAAGGESVDFSALEAGTLHYYAAGSDDITHAPLRKFVDLKRMILSVRLRHDNEYGWVIYVGSSLSQFFPTPGTHVNVVISRRNCKFQITNPQRTMATEMIAQRGMWQEVQHTQQSFMLYSTEHHELIYSWLNSFMRVDEYIENSFVPSLFAFIEVIGNDTDYVLYADTLAYRQFLRRKA